MEKTKNTISTIEDSFGLEDFVSGEGGRDEDRQRRPHREPCGMNEERSHVINDKLLHPQFAATTTNIQLLHKLISSVDQFGEYCVLDITSEGMTFGITDGNVCKVRLNLNRKIFNSYTFNGVWKENGKKYSDDQIYGDETDLSDEDSSDLHETNGFDTNGVISIYINLTSFIESINILMKDSKVGDNIVECTFRYERNGDPFILIFEDELIVERCELSTYFSEETSNLRKEKNKQKNKHKSRNNREANSIVNDLVKDFELDAVDLDDSIFRLDSEKVLFDIIIKSDILHDIVKDMNDLMTDRFILYCKQTGDTDKRQDGSSKLIFISKSSSDSIGFSKLIVPHRKVNIPDFKVFKPLLNHDNSIDETILVDCNDLSLSSTYHHHFFAKLLKAIRLSKLIKIRKDMNGITSLLLLLGKSSINAKQNGLDKLHGSSIEFMTLESISINEFSTLGVVSTRETLMSKLGYNNDFVEQIIKNDQEIQTIRVGNDGQLITLDEFFGTHANEFAAIEHLNKNNQNNLLYNNDQSLQGNLELNEGVDHMEEFVPIENIQQRKEVPSSKAHNRIDEKRSKNILNITEQLAMSLLGHGNPTDEVMEGDLNVQVEKTFVEEGDDEIHSAGSHNKRKRMQSNNIKLRNRKKEMKKHGRNRKGEKDENNGIETVGGAIEIPLFI